MNDLLKTTVLGLIVMLIFNITSPAFANQSENGLPEKMNNLSNTEKTTITNHLEEFEIETAENSKVLSRENKQIARNSLEDIEKNLIYTEVKNGEKNIILGTDNEDTFVAITDETIDVVEQVGEYDFLINGEKHHFEVSIHDDSDDDQKFSENESIEGNIQSSEANIMATWTRTSSKWVNVNASRNFSTYSASTLGGIIGAIMGTALGFGAGSAIGASAGVAAAYNYAAASQYPTNVGSSHMLIYRNGNKPTSKYKIISSDYAVYKGAKKYLGTSTSYNTPCVGCGV